MKNEKPNKPASQYDSMSVTIIETNVLTMLKLSRESQMEMYEALEYLRMSNRYKEHPGYNKASFWLYLDDIFTIREATYRDNVKAFTKYPAYAVEYGVGLIVKIGKRCGSGNVDDVMSDIKKAQAGRKKPLQRANIEVIVNRHRTGPRKEHLDWKSMYQTETIAHAATLEKLRTALKTIKRQDEQIVRLKKSLAVLGGTKKISHKHIEFEPHAVDASQQTGSSRMAPLM